MRHQFYIIISTIPISQTELNKELNELNKKLTIRGLKNYLTWNIFMLSFVIILSCSIFFKYIINFFKLCFKLRAKKRKNHFDHIIITRILLDLLKCHPWELTHISWIKKVAWVSSQFLKIVIMTYKHKRKNTHTFFLQSGINILCTKHILLNMSISFNEKIQLIHHVMYKYQNEI